jgi:MFS family permease
VPEAALPAQETAALEPLPAARAINYSVANLGASVFYGLFNFGMPLYLDTYRLSPELIGLLANERSFVGAIAQPIVGRISDRTRTPLGRRRPFFLIGIPLVCVGLFLLALHPPFWVMFAIMTVLAFFLSVAWDPYMALMADLFPPHQRGRVGGLIGLGTGLGNIIFALLALFMWKNNEFGVFLLVIGVLLLTWVYTFITVKEPPPPAAHQQAEARKTPIRPDPITYIRGLLKYPQAAKYTLALSLWWLGTGGVVPFITLFGEKVLGAGRDEVFILPLAAVLANALSAVPFGFVADRIGKKPVMTVGMVFFALVALVGSQSQNLTQATVALALAGMANGALALINPMLSDLVPRTRMAEFIGLGSAVFSFAQPLGSVAAGFVIGIAANFLPEHDAYRWSFIAAGGWVLLAVALLQTVRPERAVTDE